MFSIKNNTLAILVFIFGIPLFVGAVTGSATYLSIAFALSTPIAAIVSGRSRPARSGGKN